MTVAKATLTAGISFGLVNVPAKFYKTNDDRQGVTFSTFHKDCLERIREPKMCPKHGEITIDAVIKGHEIGPNSFVYLTEDEIGSKESSKVLDVQQFVPAGSIPFSKDTYYIGTDKFGVRGYATMRQALIDEGLIGVTRVSMRGRERLATIEPFGDVMVLVTHYWPEEARDTAGLVPASDPPAPAELSMARQLITGMSGEFDPTEWGDQSTARLISVINDKIAGRPVVSRETPEAPAATPDLMAALEASLKEQKPKAKRGRKAA